MKILISRKSDAIIITIALLMGTLQLTPKYLPLYRRAAVATVLSALLAVGAGFLGLGAIPLLLLMVLLLLLPVFFGLIVWIDEYGAKDYPLG